MEAGLLEPPSSIQAASPEDGATTDIAADAKPEGGEQEADEEDEEEMVSFLCDVPHSQH